MSCTNDPKTCTRFDCPLKERPGSNCLAWMISHREQLEEAAREMEIGNTKRKQERH